MSTNNICFYKELVEVKQRKTNNMLLLTACRGNLNEYKQCMRLYRISETELA